MDNLTDEEEKRKGEERKKNLLIISKMLQLLSNVPNDMRPDTDRIRKFSKVCFERTENSGGE